MRETLTISLPGKIKNDLDKTAKEEGLTRSDVVRESLREYLFLRKFRNLRAKMVQKAMAQGIFTDEDVFEKI